MKILIVYMPGYKHILTKLKIILKNHKITFKVLDRKLLNMQHFKDITYVITIGGDGTFLRTSHHIFDKIPLIGINPNPDRKEGFFCWADANDFEEKISSLFITPPKIIRFPRLYAKINGKILDDLALNEFYFGQKTGYHMSKYRLTINNASENQKSSGVLIGTAQSSHSWIGSAGGKILTPCENRFQYIVREPYHGKLSKIKMTSGILSKEKKIILVPQSKGFMLVVDSLKEFRLNQNDVIEIGFSGKDLNSIWG